MAQKQYTTYQADILSFELRDALIGIMKPGRYMGFNEMTEYQAQSGDNVYCRISHNPGVSKYDQDYPTPVLEAERGVAISTQGTIIADDGDVDVVVPLITGGAITGVWHIVYMEHVYIATPGANNATYGLRSGTDGGGKPTLSYPTKQIALGYIYEPAGANDFSDLTYFPATSFQNYGQDNIGKKLWGNDAEVLLNEHGSGEVGIIPADGVIGTRRFTEQNYVTNLESLTSFINDLDMGLKDVADDLAEVGGRAIDSVDWGALSDNTNHNVSISAHGLFPKLPGQQSQIFFFESEGHWVTPDSNWIWLDDNGPQLNTVTLGNLDPYVNGPIDVSAIIGESNATEILVTMGWRRNGGSVNTAWGYARLSADSNCRDFLELHMLCPPADIPTSFYVQRVTGVVKVYQDYIYLTYGNILGTPGTWNNNTYGVNNEFYIQILGYRKGGAIL